MSKFVYLSYPAMEGIPDWIQKIKEYKHQDVCLLDPYDPNQIQDPAVQACLNRDPNETAVQWKEAFKLEPMLFLPPNESVATRFVINERKPVLDNYKSMYCLLRADVMLVDMNLASYGDVAQEVLYAWLWNIPVIGITNRFINSSWVQSRCKMLLMPRNSSEIVEQILLVKREPKPAEQVKVD